MVPRAFSGSGSVLEGSLLGLATQLVAALDRHAGCFRVCREQSLCHSSQVLRDRRQKKLVVSSVRPTQAQAIKSQDLLEVRKEHLHFLVILASLLVSIRLGDVPGDSACG
jgi:hypothetical protein